MSPADLRAIGVAARNLLEFAIARDGDARTFLHVAIEAVCVTYETDSTRSAAVIRRVLEPVNLQKHGFEMLHTLGRQVTTLLSKDPELVEAIYVAAFQHPEYSDAPTPMGGRIVPMTSNRKQDYDMGLYQLAKSFPAFLKQDPVRATRALVGVVREYVERRHTYGDGTRDDATFRVGETDAVICDDFSSSWDEGTYDHDPEIRMLDAWEDYLAELPASRSNHETMEQILASVAAENRYAALEALAGGRSASAGRTCRSPQAALDG
jgi:hypothetical protein